MSTRRDDCFTDTFDRFEKGKRERGRFGDNESAPPARGRVSGASDLVDIKVYFVRSTEKAIGIARSDHAGGIIWLPKSQCQVEPREPKPNSLCEVTLPQWLAKEKGLL